MAVARIRALLSLVMLAGFYLVALGQLLAIVLFTYWISTYLPGPVGLLLTIPLYVVAIGSVCAALWAALRSRHEPLPGVVVTAQQDPALWAMVRELAELAQTRVPDEIRVVAEVNAAVSEASRFLGLKSGRRYLYIGIVLLQSLSLPEIRAIVAHELGHYSHAHTRLGSVAYRGRQAIGGTVARIHRLDPIGWLFRLYFRLYRAVDHAVSRRQELQADAHAVRAAGGPATVSALTEIHVLAAAFSHFLDNQVSPRADYGYLPDDLYSGFAAFLAERREDLAPLRDEVLADRGSAWDTHPPMRERIRAIERWPHADATPAPQDAQGLVSDLPQLSRVLTPHVLPHANCEVLAWPEFVTAASNAQLQIEADRALRVIRQRAAQPDAPVSKTLALLGPADPEVVGQLQLVLGLAALRSGVARWSASWNGPTALVDADGDPLPLHDLARLVRKPGGADRLERRLREMGIELDAAADRKARSDDRGVRLLGGIGNVKTEDKRFSREADVLILNTGLVLIETSRDSDEGNKRMQAILDRWSLPEIIRRYPFVPLQEIVSVEITRKVPLRARLALRDGRIIALRESWTGDNLTGDSPDVLRGLLAKYP